MTDEEEDRRSENCATNCDNCYARYESDDLGWVVAQAVGNQAEAEELKLGTGYYRCRTHGRKQGRRVCEINPYSKCNK